MTSTPEEIAARRFGIDPLLLESVCWWETRGERRRGREDAARGDHGKALGRCQVQVGTAAHLLGLGAEDLTPPVTRAIRRMLHEPALGAHFSGWELRWCLDHRPTLEKALFCYQGGRHKRWRGPTKGTRAVMARYRAAAHTR